MSYNNVYLGNPFEKTKLLLSSDDHITGMITTITPGYITGHAIHYM